MKLKLILSLALVLSGGLFGCSNSPNGSTAAVRANQSQTLPMDATWKTMLHDATTNGVLGPQVVAGFRSFFSVPADVAKVLESEPSAKLLPFLNKLRAEPPPWRAGVVNTWIMIVTNSFRGTPSVSTNSLISSNGVVVWSREIPIYTYSAPIIQPFHIIAWPEREVGPLAWPKPQNAIEILDNRFASASTNALGTAADINMVKAAIVATHRKIQVEDLRWLSGDLVMVRARTQESSWYYVVERKKKGWSVLTYYLKWIS
jgi:hypothetical protein